MSKTTQRSRRYFEKQPFTIKANTRTRTLKFSDNTTKEFSFITHEVTGLTGTMVPVTYTLEKSGDVGLFSMSIGYTQILLKQDHDPSDPNKFATKDGKKYICLRESDGLRVAVKADGKKGGKWSLKITVGSTPLSDNPIEEETNNNGRLDHDKSHN